MSEIDIYWFGRGKFVGEVIKTGIGEWPYARWDGERWLYFKPKEEMEERRREEAEKVYHKEDIKKLYDWQYAQAMEYINKYISYMRRSYSIKLIISGPNGVGKTFIARAILKELIIQGHSTVEVFSGQLFSDLDRYDWEETPTVQDLRSTRVWLLDDFGKGVFTDRSISRFQGLLDEFIDNQFYGLIITTEKTPKQLEELLGNAIVSRVFGTAQVLELEGPDVRFVPKEKRAYINEEPPF